MHFSTKKIPCTDFHLAISAIFQGFDKSLALYVAVLLVIRDLPRLFMRNLQFSSNYNILQFYFPLV